MPVHWWEWVFSGVGVLALATSIEVVRRRRVTPEPETRSQLQMGGSGNIQIGGDVSLKLEVPPGAKTKFDRISDLEARFSLLADHLQPMLAIHTERLELIFTSRIWGFSTPVAVPPSVPAATLAQALVETLGLMDAVELPGDRERTRVFWQLALEDGTLIDPEKSLRSAGLSSGDVVHLHGEVAKADVNFKKDSKGRILGSYSSGRTWPIEDWIA